MTYIGPGIYTAREEARAVAAGEYLKGVEESPHEWCEAVEPGVRPYGGRVCYFPAGHAGKHDWQRFPWPR